MTQSVDELLIAHLFACLSCDLFQVVCTELSTPRPSQFLLFLHQEHQSVNGCVHRNVHFESIHLNLFIQFEWQLNWRNHRGHRLAMRCTLVRRDLMRGNIVIVLKATITCTSILNLLTKDATTVLAKVLRQKAGLHLCGIHGLELTRRGHGRCLYVIAHLS